MTTRHVSITNLPGYRTPATAAEIPEFPGSYGFVRLNGALISLTPTGIVQDQNGKLWANPKAYLMREQPLDGTPWAAVSWTENGLGVHVPEHSYFAIARRKYQPEHLEGWIPVVEVLGSVPGIPA